MARQLSEQLEREVNADELLKAQSKTKPGTSVPGHRSLPHRQQRLPLLLRP